MDVPLLEPLQKFQKEGSFVIKLAEGKAPPHLIYLVKE